MVTFISRFQSSANQQQPKPQPQNPLQTNMAAASAAAAATNSAYQQQLQYLAAAAYSTPLDILKALSLDSAQVSYPIVFSFKSML